MDRAGSYSKLDRVEEEEIELTEQVHDTQDQVSGDEAPKPQVDYVLVYETCKETELDDDAAAEAEKLARWRRNFEGYLTKRLGLSLQHETVIPEEDPEKERCYVLIHVPWERLAQKAESMKLKVPLQVNDVVFTSWLEDLIGSARVNKLESINPLVVHDATVKEKVTYFMAPFMEEYLTEYVNHEHKEHIFSTVDRHYIVQQLLQNARFKRGQDGFGLNRLLLDGAYIAGYPLHDGSDTVEAGEAPTNDRQRLRRDWGRFGRCFKYQPYNAIKDYFGHEIALYFAWLGFYTAMLVPLAIFAGMVFIYGVISASSYTPVQDICDAGNRGRWYMCPLCDKQCSYWDLAPTTCAYAYVTHFFDNDGTVFLAFVASIWATLFLEFWKRRQATFAQEWHTTDFEEEDEQLRPAYKRSLPAEQLSLFKENPKTGKIEPVVSKIRKYHRYGTIFSMVGFMILLVIGTAVAIVVYRAAVFAVMSSNNDKEVQKRARIVTTASAACLNLVAITLLTKVYIKLAVWLTDWENPPTQTAYRNSFTFKMSLFQFVNNYTAILYIAFFKSEMIVGSPGKYRRVLGKYRLDGCSEQGCFLELAIQLFIIMVGKQIFSNIFEIGIPYLKLKKSNMSKTKIEESPQHVKDYDLSAFDEHNMFWEYLEVVLQYGFVTMFVAAFPLGPLFALINGIIEIRVDSTKFLCHFRRPDTNRVETIGAWSSVLEALTKASVLVNAFVLAFTSEFIPKLLYKIMYAPDRNSPGGGTLKGYVNFTLSAIDLKTLYTWEAGTQPDNPTEMLNYTRSYCRYKGYQENTYPYHFSREYWHILTARLAFVFVFQFVVYSTTNLIAWMVPDTPDELKFKEEREREVVRSLLEERDDVSDFEEEEEEEKEEEEDPAEFKDALQELNSEELA